jgi:hypothetical protein
MITILPKDPIKDEALSALARVDIAVASMACAEKTKRTKIRARAFLLALLLLTLDLIAVWTAGAYVNRNAGYSVSISIPDATPPAEAPFSKQRGGGRV